MHSGQSFWPIRLSRLSVLPTEPLNGGKGNRWKAQENLGDPPEDVLEDPAAARAEAAGRKNRQKAGGSFSAAARLLSVFFWAG